MSSNQTERATPLKSSSSRLRRLVTPLLLIGLGLNIIAVLPQDSFPRQLARAVFSGNRQSLIHTADLDNVFAAAPNRGNALLTFEGFDRASENSVELAYYRAAYLLYPRRVFAAAPGRVVNRGRDILDAPFALTDEALQTNEITFLINFVRDASGTITYSASRRQ